MADPLEKQLQAIRPGKSKRLKGLTVRRDGSSYIVDGDTLTLEEAVQRLNETAAPKAGIDYAWTAFIEKAPGSNNHTAGIIKVHKVKDKAGHAALVEEVKSRQNYLWYGRVVKSAEGRYSVPPPLIIDFDTVPDQPYVESPGGKRSLPPPPPPDPKLWDGGLSCPFCRQEVSSTPGRTLHVKSQHPDQFQQYLELVNKSLAKPVEKPTEEPVDEPDTDDDVVSRVAESESPPGLQCPFCGHKVSSTPGRTNHVKGKHPERIDEYKQMFGL